MKKNKFIKIMAICIVILAVLTVTCLEILNKEQLAVFENLICKENEVSIEKIDLEKTINLETSEMDKVKQQITSLLANEMIEEVECYQIVYNFGFEGVDDVYGEMVALAIVSANGINKKIEDAIVLDTNIYSEEYEMSWVEGSNSTEINAAKNSARISESGYLEIKLKNKIYYSNTISPVYIFEM